MIIIIALLNNLLLAKRNKIVAFISHSFKTRESKTITLQFQIIEGEEVLIKREVRQRT